MLLQIILPEENKNPYLCVMSNEEIKNQTTKSSAAQEQAEKESADRAFALKSIQQEDVD